MLFICSDLFFYLFIFIIYFYTHKKLQKNDLHITGFVLTINAKKSEIWDCVSDKRDSFIYLLIYYFNEKCLNYSYRDFCKISTVTQWETKQNKNFKNDLMNENHS